jgi:putative membrane protein
MEMASQSNAAEMEAGRLALEKSQDEAVQRIAQTLITDHTKAQSQLQEIAARHRINLPSSPDALHREMAARLQTLSGADFDRTFIAGQVRDHLIAVSLFEHAANLTKDPEVSAYATNTLPALRHHTAEILQIAQRLKINISTLEHPGMRNGSRPAGTGTGNTTGTEEPLGTANPVGSGTATATGAVGQPAAPNVTISLESLRARPGGYMNRTLLITARISEKVGNRAYYLVPTTGAAASGGTGSQTPATPPTTGASDTRQGILAVLGDSYTDANLPNLSVGQIVQVRAKARDPKQADTLGTSSLSADLRERLPKEPVLLWLESITPSAP